MAIVDNELPEKLGHNHPLFLSSIDNSGATLISIQLTGTENFSVWSRAMRIAILGRNKLGFIEGTCVKEAYGPNLTALWDRCNAIVLSWIMNCVSKELLGGIVYSTNAAAVWSDLKERYDKVDGSRIFQLYKEIASASQGTSSISVYFARLRDLWVEFDSITPVPGCDCAKSRDFVMFMDNQKLLQFLMGLNESYEQASGQILMMIPLPSLNKAYSMLIEPESQRSMSQSHKSGSQTEITALASIRTGSNPENRLKKPFSPYSYDPNAVCDHCKRKGHTKAICFRLIGYPPDFERRRRENQANQQSDKGNYHTERGSNYQTERGGGNYRTERGGNYHTAHNVVGSTMMYQDQAPNFSGNINYNKGIEVIHEQYNQILHMLGKSNLLGGSDMGTSSHGPNTGSANSIQGPSSTNTTGNTSHYTISNHDWIVDSGATNHMTYNSNVLEQLKTVSPNTPNQVHLPTGETTTVTHSGSCNITKHDNDLYNRQVKVIGRESDGLYFLPAHTAHNTNQVSSNHIHSSNAHEDTHSQVLLWHQRLGHTSSSVLAHVLPNSSKHSSVEMIVQECCGYS
ncbi:hypothetical protein KY284_023311 [Solanum tuberosum]|nr:hypothetical protein KY284_023311 [Solanum tuberosum]